MTTYNRFMRKIDNLPFDQRDSARMWAYALIKDLCEQIDKLDEQYAADCADVQETVFDWEERKHMLDTLADKHFDATRKLYAECRIRMKRWF